ncbi:hypothetical protein [Streptomyces sp. NPDC048643]|uniref:hypothetical protein n=1 Tax=Streptomyces sp. NPDC048643 TaxID=3155637 RepID=UPI0034469537
MAAKLRVRIPGEGPVLENRITGLAALTGFSVGLGMGMGLALARAIGWRPSKISCCVVSSFGALIVTNAPIIVLGLTDPRTWEGMDWIADIIPHVAYAVVTTEVLDRLEAPRQREPGGL